MNGREDRGCQLLELEELDKVVKWPGCNPIAVALLSWVAETIQKEQAGELAGVKLQVIVANYLGKYPALGLWYPAEEIDRFDSDGFVNDRGPLVQEAGTRLVLQRLPEFLDYLNNNGPIDWAARTNAMFEGTEHLVS